MNRLSVHLMGALAVILLPFVLTPACSSSLTNPDQWDPDAMVTARLWTGNQLCDTCLRIVAGNADAGSDSYGTCRDDIGCREAIATFTQCYAEQPSIEDCAAQIFAVRSASSAGGELLDHFLLKCYFAHCETVRPVTPH